MARAWGAAAMLAAAGKTAAQPTITDLGVLPGTLGSDAVAITPDGSVVIGNSGDNIYRWTQAGGLQALTLPLGGSRPRCTAVSADGSIIVGRILIGSAAQACRWEITPNAPSGVWLGLGSIGTSVSGSSYSFAYAVSADGSAIVGESSTPGGDMGFRWTPGTGMQALAPLPPPFAQRTIGFAVSADGAVVIGRDGYSDAPVLCRWTAAAGGGGGVGAAERLEPANDIAEPLACTPNGRAVVGATVTPDANGARAFRWTASRGMQILGAPVPNFLPPGTPIVASIGTAISANGEAVAGEYRIDDTHTYAMLWTEATGPVDLKSYLASLGTDVAGWTLFQALGISADGTAVVGYASHNDARRAYLVRGLPPFVCNGRPAACPADFDCSGRLAVDDILNFLTAWLAGDGRADFGGWIGLDASDISEFLTAWFAGC